MALQGLSGRSLQAPSRSLAAFSTIDSTGTTYLIYHNQALAFDGSYLYTSISSSLHKYDTSVALVDTGSMGNPLTLNSATARDLTYDGTHIYTISTPKDVETYKMMVQQFDTDLNLLSYAYIPRESGAANWPISQPRAYSITHDTSNLYVAMHEGFATPRYSNDFVLTLSKTLGGGAVTETDRWSIPIGSKKIHHYDGEIFVSVGSSIKVYSTTGTLDRTLTGIATANGIFADTNGMYVSMATGVQVYDTSEVLTQTVSNSVPVYDCFVDGSDLWFISGYRTLHKATI